MTNNISLLPNQTRFRLDQMRLARKVKKAALWGAGGLVAGLIVVWGVFFINKNLLSRSEQRLETVQLDFKSLGKEVEMNQETRYRLKLVSKIMTERFNYGRVIKTALDFLPEETKLDELGFEGNGVLGLGGCLDSYELMDAFEKKLENKSGFEQEGILTANLKGLRVKDNNWCFELEVGVKI